jgi:hypothetical protein
VLTHIEPVDMCQTRAIRVALRPQNSVRVLTAEVFERMGPAAAGSPAPIDPTDRTSAEPW